MISVGFHSSWRQDALRQLRHELLPLQNHLIDSRLASWLLRTPIDFCDLIDFNRFSLIFMDCWLVGCSTGLLDGLVTKPLGSLSLLGLPKGVFGFLFLLGGGLNHVVSHARRSKRSVDTMMETTFV